MTRSNHHSEADGTVQERLVTRGIRFTEGRRAVVHELERVAGPVSAAELDDRLRGRVPLSSLYRTLTVLDEAGVVDTHHGPDGVVRYELAEWLSGHHHHISCVDCGAIADIALSEAQENLLEQISAAVATPAGFVVQGHALDIHGRCDGCST